MAYLSQEQLIDIGFRKLGRNVRISDRAAIHDAELLEIGDNSRIDDFCVISGNVNIGRNVHIAVFNNIAGGELGIILEDFCGVAYGCHIFSQADDYSGKTLTNPTCPDAYKDETKAQVRIGRHVIIGTGSIVLPGITIAEGCAIGAASMVTKSTEPWSIYVGSPARRIRARSQELLALEAAYLGERPR